jgi:hypothetical protein
LFRSDGHSCKPQLASRCCAYHGGLNTTATTNNRLNAFGYDSAGNITSNGSVTYTYDGENRLTQTAGYTYTYDGDGKRVMKSSGSSGTL